jgi:hypothetical protein
MDNDRHARSIAGDAADLKTVLRATAISASMYFAYLNPEVLLVNWCAVLSLKIKPVNPDFFTAPKPDFTVLQTTMTRIFQNTDTRVRVSFPFTHLRCY